MAQIRALILSGRGRYEDPWHEHAGSSYELGKLLEEMGMEVVVRSMFQDCADDLEDFDFLLVNGSWGRVDPWFDGIDEEWVATHEKIAAYARAGKPILVHHNSINSFKDSPYWREIVGGRWVRGKTHHPKISDAEFVVIPDSHPIVEGLGNVHVFDERYTFLEPEPGVTVFLKQWEKEQWHASAWVNEQGGVRVVYDALGHQPAAVNNPERRELLRREINWLLGRCPTASGELAGAE